MKYDPSYYIFHIELDIDTCFRVHSYGTKVMDADALQYYPKR